MKPRKSTTEHKLFKVMFVVSRFSSTTDLSQKEENLKKEKDKLNAYITEIKNRENYNRLLHSIAAKLFNPYKNLIL